MNLPTNQLTDKKTLPAPSSLTSLINQGWLHYCLPDRSPEDCWVPAARRHFLFGLQLFVCWQLSEANTDTQRKLTAQPPLFPLLLRQVFISAVTAATTAYPADTPAKWIRHSVWVCVTPWQVCAKSVAAEGSEDVLVSTLLFSCRKAKGTSLWRLFFFFCADASFLF